MTQPEATIATEERISITETGQVAGLAQTEIQALFQLVIKRAVPSPTDGLSITEAMLVLAAGTLKGYGFDYPSVLTVMSHMWAWFGHGPVDHRSMIFNVIDRRYVGWSCAGRKVLVDMTTGEEIRPYQRLSRVLESIAYNLCELLARKMAMVRGERTSLWER